MQALDPGITPSIPLSHIEQLVPTTNITLTGPSIATHIYAHNVTLDMLVYTANVRTSASQPE